MALDKTLRSALAALACAVPLLVVLPAPTVAGHRHHDDRWSWSGGRHWDHRHWQHQHRHHRHGHYRHHRHRGSGVSGLFVWNLTPPPPRRVVVVPPPVIVHQPPPAVVYAPPPQAYCREYTSSAMVNGRPVETWGTACLQPDGRWRIVSAN